MKLKPPKTNPLRGTDAFMFLLASCFCCGMAGCAQQLDEHDAQGGASMRDEIEDLSTSYRRLDEAVAFITKEQIRLDREQQRLKNEQRRIDENLFDKKNRIPNVATKSEPQFTLVGSWGFLDGSSPPVMSIHFKKDWRFVYVLPRHEVNGQLAVTGTYAADCNESNGSVTLDFDAGHLSTSIN